MTDFNIHKNPTVKETPFREIYLPLLMNMKTMEERERWINEVAINVFTRVNVVSDTDANDVLFWVPAMNYTPKTKIGGNFIAVTSEHTRIADNRGDRAAHNYHRKAFAGIMQQPAPPEEDIKQWGIIAERYGLKEAQRSDTRKQEVILNAVEEDW